MLDKLNSWVKGFSEEGSAVPAGDDEFVVAITGLLIEAAMADGVLDDGEKAQILDLLIGQMEMDSVSAQKLLDETIIAHDQRIEIHGLIREIRSDTEMEDRAIILEMIWVVVLSDGRVDVHESQLMRRLAGLLYIDDVTSGIAQKRARARLGLAG